MKLEKINDDLNEKLKDPYFKELYELEDQKLQIVKRIVAYRLKSELSQKQLADKAGVSQQHISKIENGEFSSILTLERVLIFIGYTVKIQAVPLKPATLKKLNRLLHRRNLKAA